MTAAKPWVAAIGDMALPATCEPRTPHITLPSRPIGVLGRDVTECTRLQQPFQLDSRRIVDKA